jgi:hypothetical protein
MVSGTRSMTSVADALRGYTPSGSVTVAPGQRTCRGRTTRCRTYAPPNRPPASARRQPREEDGMTITVKLLPPGSMGAAVGAQLRAGATSCFGAPTDAATRPAAGRSTQEWNQWRCLRSSRARTCCSPSAHPAPQRMSPLRSPSSAQPTRARSTSKRTPSLPRACSASPTVWPTRQSLAPWSDRLRRTGRIRHCTYQGPAAKLVPLQRKTDAEEAARAAEKARKAAKKAKNTKKNRAEAKKPGKLKKPTK